VSVSQDKKTEKQKNQKLSQKLKHPQKQKRRLYLNLQDYQDRNQNSCTPTDRYKVLFALKL